MNDAEKPTEKIVREAVQCLREHFDHVQIVVSWEEDVTGRTKSIFRGSGNWFSRVGMMREFLREDDARTKANEIKNALHPDGEDGVQI